MAKGDYERLPVIYVYCKDVARAGGGGGWHVTKKYYLLGRITYIVYLSILLNPGIVFKI